MSTEIGPTCRQAIEKREGSSANPRVPSEPALRPEPIYAIGSQEYAAQQERLRLQRLEQGEDEGE